MTSVNWTVVKPRGDINENNEIKSFSVREVISTDKNAFIGEIYSLNLNTSASINNLFDIRVSNAYYAILVKNDENPGWFKLMILGKDISLDTRVSNILDEYFPDNNQNRNLFLMIIEDNDFLVFDEIIFRKIEFGTRIIFNMMMDDYLMAIQDYSSSVFRNLINSFLGTGQNPFGEEVHRVIKEADLSQLPRLNYDNFIKYNQEQNGKINTECFITLNDFKEGDEIIILPCNHAYIASEIEKWLKENSHKCPVCRKAVGEGELINLE